jgi:hypothetical protein
MKQPPAVAVEFKGKARAFMRRRVKESTQFVQTANSLDAKIRKRLDRGSTIRPEMMLDYERALRDRNPNPHTYFWDRRQAEMCMLDSYYCMSRIRAAGWGGPRIDSPEEMTHLNSEDSLDLHTGATRITREMLETRDHCALTVGLHALGRRMQRGFDCSDEAILVDLDHLWDVWHRCMFPKEGAEREVLGTGELRFETPGGIWFGRLVFNRFAEEGDLPYLRLRTFHHGVLVP